MNLSKDEMDFLETVMFSEENMKSEFKNWVESHELYLREREGVLLV